MDNLFFSTLPLRIIFLFSLSFNFYSRSLDIKWVNDDDISKILWKGLREYDNHEYTREKEEGRKEGLKKLGKIQMNFMDTESDVTFELHELEKGPTSCEEIDKEVETRIREVRKKFRKAARVDENAKRPFKRGWCQEHQDWCPINSQCIPEDPLEKDRYWMIEKRRWEDKVEFYNQKTEEEMRLRYAEESVNVLTTWQYKATQMLTEDMNRIKNYKLWPFTSYSPWPDHRSMPGEMVDVSQEEMRYLMYEKKKLQKEEQYILFEQNLKEAHEDFRSVVKPGLRQSPSSWYKHIPLHYFNSVVEGNEEDLKIKCHILKCKLSWKGGYLEHFTLTNCPSCGKKTKQEAIKSSNEDRNHKRVENKAHIKMTRKVEVKEKESLDDEESSSEDADNPDKVSETEEVLMTDEELAWKRKSAIEDARFSEFKRKYMASTTCKFCNKVFPSKKYRKQHEQRNHSDKLKVYQCQQCYKNFTNSTALKYHMANKHGEQQNILCKYCKLEFNSYKEYVEHRKCLRRMLTERNPKCNKCDIRISRKHMKRHHKDVHQQVLLKGNRKPVVLEESTKILKCDNCRKKFKREEHLIRHISEVHIEADKFSCKYCDKLFKRKQHLNVHILKSHLPFFKNFKCHICQKNFDQKCHRDRHVQEVHEETKYKCVQCKKTFTQKSDKERHTKEVHEPSEKNFKCPNCEKTFARKFSQTRHTKLCILKS